MSTNRTAVDFAARKIPGSAIKSAGHSAVIAYVSPPRPGAEWMEAKPITRQYAQELLAAGLSIASVWQYGKPGDATPSDWTTGFDGGIRMAQQADENHIVAGGGPDRPIFFAVDEDITIDKWNSTAVEFFRGVKQVLGNRTGIYGHSRVIAWAVEDDVIGSAGGGKYWAWQCNTWPRGVDPVPEAVLYQRIIDTPSTPGPKIDGSAVDVSDILADDFGQWGEPAGEERPVANTKPAFTEIDMMGDSRSNRWGARVTNFLLHTQEGDGSAVSLATYLNNQGNGVSYHYTLRDGTLANVVDTDYASWSVLDANAYTINLCFAGSRASWSRNAWLDIIDDIRIAAWVAVQDARKYGFSTKVVSPPYARQDGVSDHAYVTRALGIGSHTDVGPNFPWDVFSGFVDEYSGVVPAPVDNAINVSASRNAWLGARITKGENPTADGDGRFAEFENGYVYWHRSTGAWPVPRNVFAKWAATKYEAGVLGYPIGAAAEINGGVVQGFQNGAIYVKNGTPGAVVRGAIRDRWNKTGFETGPLGWPKSDEKPVTDGAVQEFDKGRVYWVPKNVLTVLNTEGVQ